jgi:hypothetical protein
MKSFWRPNERKQSRACVITPADEHRIVEIATGIILSLRYVRLIDPPSAACSLLNGLRMRIRLRRLNLRV